MTQRPTELKAHDEEGHPSYRLIATLQTPAVNPGEQISISIFAVGYGKVEKASLHVNFDHPNLLDEEEPGKFILNIRPVTDRSNGFSAPVPGLVQVSPITNRFYTTIGVRPLFWDRTALREIIELMDVGSPTGWLNERSPSNEYSPIVFSRSSSLVDLSTTELNDHRDSIENADKPKSPIEVELNTLQSKSSIKSRNTRDKTAQPGDYQITFTLTYGNSLNVYQDQAVVQVHVNSWLERNSMKIRILAGIAALAAMPTIVDNIVRLIAELQNLF